MLLRFTTLNYVGKPTVAAVNPAAVSFVYTSMHSSGALMTRIVMLGGATVLVTEDLDYVIEEVEKAMVLTRPTVAF